MSKYSFAGTLKAVKVTKEGTKSFRLLHFVPDAEYTVPHKFVNDHDVLVEEKEDVRGLKNAITVFGKENVRAYMAGIPDVFGAGTVEDVKRLMYPYDQPGWNIPEFTADGVLRKGV